jgi:hypothetical protein
MWSAVMSLQFCPSIHPCIDPSSIPNPSDINRFWSTLFILGKLRALFFKFFFFFFFSFPNLSFSSHVYLIQTGLFLSENCVDQSNHSHAIVGSRVMGFGGTQKSNTPGVHQMAQTHPYHIFMLGRSTCTRNILVPLPGPLILFWLIN